MAGLHRTRVVSIVLALAAAGCRKDHAVGATPEASASAAPTSSAVTSASAPVPLAAPADVPSAAPTDAASALAPSTAPSGSAGTTAAVDTCIDPTTARRADGSAQACYPYRCRRGACLTACATSDDCAPGAKPGESLSKGWPIICEAPPRCTPMPPHVVRREQKSGRLH